MSDQGGKNSPGPRGGWLPRQLRRRPRPAWMVALAHLLALGVALVLYALPHHVLPSRQQATGIVSTRESIRQTAAPEPSAEAIEYDDEGDPIVPDTGPTPEPTPEPVGSFRNKFADKVTDGEVIRTDNTYQSANLNITFQKKYFDELMSRVYYADIYIADISCLKTVLAEDTFGRGYKEWITKAARRMGSVVTMNGDYYGSRDFGVVVRNGILYRDAKNIRDVAVLYWDGSFETIPPERFDAKQIMTEGAYQCWHFGPRLLDDAGHAMTEFNADSHMKKRHPRSAFGYFEPGHYCFVVVDGRLDESKGVKLDGLSRVMEGLGCVAAYNLDGGQTSLLAKGDKLVNRPSGGGRSASDFIIVVDEVS